MKTKTLVIIALVAVIVGFVIYKKRDVIMAMFRKKTDEALPGNSGVANNDKNETPVVPMATVSTTGATANPNVIKTTGTPQVVKLDTTALPNNYVKEQDMVEKRTVKNNLPKLLKLKNTDNSNSNHGIPVGKGAEPTVAKPTNDIPDKVSNAFKVNKANAQKFDTKFLPVKREATPVRFEMM
jgi:hypothetical protein